MNSTMTVGEPVRPGASRRGAPPAGEPPTAVEWLRRFADVSDPGRALEVWNEAALATDCLGMALGPGDLQRIGDWLVAHCDDAPIRMAARSCLVRLRVHLMFHPVS